MGSIDLVTLILLFMGFGTVLMVVVAAIKALVSRKRDIPYVPRHDMDGDAEAMENPDSVEQQTVRPRHRERGGKVHRSGNPLRRYIG